MIASQKVVGSNPSVGKNVYHENSVKIHLYDHRAVEFYIKHVRDVLCFFVYSANVADVPQIEIKVLKR